jgi:hypothetical protein
MKKIANKMELIVDFEGQGLVNFDGGEIPFRFKSKMTNNGKVASNGRFAKENIYVDKVTEDGVEKKVYRYEKIMSSNLIRKVILGSDNSVNADKISTNDKLRVAYLAQDLSIARGYCILGKTDTDIKRRSGVSVTDAKQTSNTVSWLEQKTAEGLRDDTSIFYKETCGDIEYQSKIFYDIKQLQFISCDENYDRVSIASTDIDGVVKAIDARYGEGSATFGNWGTTITNLIGEQGIVLSNKVVTNVMRETIKNILGFEVKRAGSYARIKAVRLAIGYSEDKIVLGSTPTFIDIKSIDEYDKLVEGIEFGVEFLPIEIPVLEKIEKQPKKSAK